MSVIELGNWRRSFYVRVLQMMKLGAEAQALHDDRQACRMLSAN